MRYRLITIYNNGLITHNYFATEEKAQKYIIDNPFQGVISATIVDMFEALSLGG